MKWLAIYEDSCLFDPDFASIFDRICASQPLYAFPLPFFFLCDSIANPVSRLSASASRFIRGHPLQVSSLVVVNALLLHFLETALKAEALRPTPISPPWYAYCPFSLSLSCCLLSVSYVSSYFFHSNFAYIYIYSLLIKKLYIYSLRSNVIGIEY